jgi:hypothetical protein
VALVVVAALLLPLQQLEMQHMAAAEMQAVGTTCRWELWIACCMLHVLICSFNMRL